MWVARGDEGMVCITGQQWIDTVRDLAVDYLQSRNPRHWDCVHTGEML